MKKLIALLLAVILAISLCACGGGNETKETTEEPTESASSGIVSCAGYAVEKLKSVLKNPNSLIINNRYAVDAEDCCIFAIDYSAENGFGGMNRDYLFLSVNEIENGFAVRTYGTGSFTEAENQKYSAQFFAKYNKISGAYILDPTTYQVLGIDVTNIDTTINQRVELVGKMKGEKRESTGYGGAWDFELDGDPYLKVVYFAEGADLEWYKQFTGFPYEITISAIKDENGNYREAEILEDTVRNATDEERFQRFNYYDRKILAETVPSSGKTPMTADAIHSALDEKTFSMRNNYGGDVDGTHTITFYANGSLDAKYTYEGKEYTMYESWKVVDGAVVMKKDTSERTFDAYEFDNGRILLIGRGYDADSSMILTDNH